MHIHSTFMVCLISSEEYKHIKFETMQLTSHVLLKLRINEVFKIPSFNSFEHVSYAHDQQQQQQTFGSQKGAQS